MEQEEQFLKISEIKKRLSCSDSMIRKLRKKGLPCLKLGSEYRYCLQSVVKFLKESQAK